MVGPRASSSKRVAPTKCILIPLFLLLAGCTTTTPSSGGDQTAWEPLPCDPSQTNWIGDNAERVFPPADEELARELFASAVASAFGVERPVVNVSIELAEGEGFYEAKPTNKPGSEWYTEPRWVYHSQMNRQQLSDRQIQQNLQSLYAILAGSANIPVEITVWNQTFEEHHFSFADIYQTTPLNEPLAVGNLANGDYTVDPIYIFREVKQLEPTKARSLAYEFLDCVWRTSPVPSPLPTNVDFSTASNGNDWVRTGVVSDSLVLWVSFPWKDESMWETCGAVAAVVVVDAISGAAHGHDQFNDYEDCKYEYHNG